MTKRELLIQLGDTLLRRSESTDKTVVDVIEAELEWMMRHTPGASQADETSWRYELKFSIAWAACGFPQITMGHKLAASLMATTIPLEYVDPYQPPWTAFLILVPEGLLSDSTGSRFVHRLMVIAGEDFVAVGTGGDISMWHTSCSMAGILSTVARYDEEDGTIDLFALLAHRLVVNACLELETSGGQVANYERRSIKATNRKSKLPTVRNYVLTRDVRMDCRSWVQKSCRLNSAEHAVQSLVRGHYKRQPCGSGRAERRWIHIEPYWRGPEDAPIALRSHALLTAKRPEGSDP